MINSTQQADDQNIFKKKIKIGAGITKEEGF